MFSVDDGSPSVRSQPIDLPLSDAFFPLLFKLESPLSKRDKTDIDLDFFLVLRLSFFLFSFVAHSSLCDLFGFILVYSVQIIFQIANQWYQNIFIG